MNKTKRLFSAVMLVAMIAVACFALVACKGDSVNNYFVTYDGQKLTVSGKKGEAVQFPEVTRDGYLFDGWYTSEDFSGSAVENAVFGEETTYYAKWAEVCTITLQPEGGEIKGTSVQIKQGTNVLQALADYTPTKGSLKFGGWFDGDTQITENSVADKGSMTLTARYMAKYTVNAYMEKPDASGEYTYLEKYSTGYAYVGEPYAPDIKVSGFVVSEAAEEKVISEDETKNVFTVYYDRKTFKVSVYESYPNGGAPVLASAKNYAYGADFIPKTEYLYEGYMMLGWATKQGATYADVIGADFSLTSDISLFPVWEAGYTDMFSGNDYIFLKHDADNTAILLRGGIKIEGKYNARYDFYIFENDAEDFRVRARIDGEHFIYYASRANSYSLLNGLTDLNTDITIALDDLDGIKYYNRKSGVTVSGKYVIDETGMYVATFEGNADVTESSSFTFVIGTYQGANAFRIRGEEYNYGEIARRGVYYPTITFDGFGTAVVKVSGQSPSNYSYSVDKNGIISLSSAQENVSLKIKEYNGQNGYDFYTADYDKTYSLRKGNVTLALDGCATAVYKNGNTETFTGTYYTKESILYDVLNGKAVYRTIVTVVADDGEKRVYLVYMDYFRNEDGVAAPGGIPIPWFEEKGATYTERRLVDNEGRLTDSYVVVDGNGNAATYEYVDKVLTKTSEGTYEAQANGYSYIYTPADNTSTVNFKHGATEFAYCDYNGLTLCFALGYTDDNTTTNLYRRYITKGTGASEELIAVSVFGIYVNADGDILCGLLSKQTTYYILTDSSKVCYLSFDETDEQKFYVLQNAPLVMSKRVDGKTDSNTKLTVTWKKITEDKTEAVYSVTDATTKETTNFPGYFTSQTLLYPGMEVYLYTFTSNDNTITFKFYLSSSGSTYYFNYFDVDSVITFGSYTQLKDDDGTDDNSKLQLTDELSDGKLVIKFTDGKNEVKGTFDNGKEVVAFGNDEYKAVVYTFTAIDGSKTFRFTLNNNYFRICSEDAAYTDDNGGLLELNGATHMAKYTDGNGKSSYSYYVVLDGVLEQNGKAIYMLVNDTETYLDLQGNKFAIRGAESGTYNIFKNGVPYGKTIEFDGQGKAVIADMDGNNTLNVTYTKDGNYITVFGAEGNELYAGKIGNVSLGGKVYPAYSLVMVSIAGSYINQSDLSVLVLDNVGNAVRYNSYGVRYDGYYFRIDDNLFYFLDSSSSFAALYTINGDKIVDTGTNMTFYSADFASVVFFASGTVLINNSEVMYYVIDANGNAKTYKAADNVDDEGTNEYGYIVGSIDIVIDETGSVPVRKVTYGTGVNQRTYTYFDGKHITFTDDEHGYTLEFQPDGGATFTVDATLTEAPAEGETEGKTTKYYVGLSYDKDGKPYVYLADAVSGLVNGGERYNFTRNFDVTIDYNEKTFSFVKTDFKIGMTAYNYMYLYYLSYFGSKAASMLSNMNGILSIVGTVNGDEITYTLSGAFNYVKVGDGQSSFVFDNGTLSAAGYYVNNYGHAYVSEFVVDGTTYHMTFFLMPPDTAKGTYAYRIYSLTKVTGEVVVDEANDTVLYNEELVYTEFNIVKGKDEAGNDVYYKAGEAFHPGLKYNGTLVGSFPFDKEGEDTLTFFNFVFSGGKLAEESRYIVNVTRDDNGNINGASVKKQVALIAKTANGDTVYGWYDGNNTVEEIVGVQFKDEEKVTEPTNSVRNADGSFTVTVKGVTYKVVFTFTVGEDGKTTITVTMTEETQQTEQQAA